MLSKGDAGTPFSVMVEPEAMSYDFPPQERVLLTFRGPVAEARFEHAHGRPATLLVRRRDPERQLASGG